MSVQAGIWHFDGRPADQRLSELSRATADFGPDGEFTHILDSIAMLYRPFHTTSESRMERQPLTFDGGTVMTWDGRLDNRQELLSQLDRPVTSYSGDVEIVGAAFAKWGTSCFNKIVGDWALTIWNPRQRELILARDYIGVRQLFYYPKLDEILWCTQLAPLARCGDSFTICDEYIAGYLAFRPDAPLTPFREIRSVPPGTFIRATSREITTHTYWTLDSVLRNTCANDAEYEEQYFYLLRQAVKRRLRADGPILSTLSGGLDSSSIVCMADDILSKEGASTPRLDTISYYDPLEPGEDDFKHLRKAEEKRGRNGFHLSVPGMGDSLSFEYTEFIATPGFGIRAEVKSAMSNVIRMGHHRVILNGTGGDEVNAQALDFRIPIADLLAHLHMMKAAKDLVAWSLISRRPFLKLLFEVILELSPLRVRAHITERGRLQPWIRAQFARRYGVRCRQLEDIEGFWCWRPGPRDAVQTITTLSKDLTQATPSKLEQRYPYLDQNLVEFLTTIPFDQLLRPGQRRSLMRRALARLLPTEILHRKTKVSAARCYPITVEKHWNEIEHILAVGISSQLGYINLHELRTDLLRLRNGDVPPYLVRLLKALSLEFWLQDIFTRRIVTVPSVLLNTSQNSHSTAAIYA